MTTLPQSDIAIRVLRAGPLALLQDRGRFGVRHLGVTQGGPVIPGARQALKSPLADCNWWRNAILILPSPEPILAPRWRAIRFRFGNGYAGPKARN